jgi:threonine/homoserine/homoserine lactone efflux protein
MTELAALVGITIALAAGAASPGPSFVMVANLAAGTSRVAGLAAALGMGAGGVVFALAALLGLHSLFVAVPALYGVLKFVGGLYLAYLGLRIWLGAKRPLNGGGEGALVPVHTATRSFWMGLTTQLSNPKTAIVYASVFAALLPTAPSLAFDAAIIAMVFAIETGWYALVAFALSTRTSRDAYLRHKSMFDRIAGAVMIALGLKLAGERA